MNKRSYEIIGLRHWNDVFNSLMIALPLAAGGFLLCYLVWRRRKDQSNNVGSGFRLLDTLGYAGLLMMVVSVWYFLPLIAWIEAILVGIFTVIFTIFIFFLVLFFGWAWISQNIRR